MAILTIGGAAMPEPSSITVTVHDLDSDSTKRNENGVLQRDRIREGVRTLSCKWSALSSSDASVIMQAIHPASFYVNYYDMETASNNTITAYSGDRSCERVASPLGPRWNIACDLIEY